MKFLWTLTIVYAKKIGMPFVILYFACCSNPLINIACEDAAGLEYVANQVLAPYQYFFNGKIAKQRINKDDLFYEFEDRFSYHDSFYLKTTASLISLLPSYTVGSLLKNIALLSKASSKRYKNVLSSLNSKKIYSNNQSFSAYNVNFPGKDSTEMLIGQNHPRRPGDEKNLHAEKECLKQIITILNKHNIINWVDCGTLLGTYRHGGVIPWDDDLDLAVFSKDFDNVLRALNDLDKDKYQVLDWSPRGYPKTLLKVYVKESDGLVDLYQYNIIPENDQIAVNFAFEEHLFYPEWWRKRERRYAAPHPISSIFPLKKANFDGIEVFVPNDTVKYLQVFYGKNIDPAMVYDKNTCQYEKVLDHPYWSFGH